MLDNIKHVLSQHKKFLAIFLIIIFVPAIILAFFGIRAINNERYKLSQIILEQQQELARTLKTEVRALLEKEISGLIELSTSQAMIDGSYQRISEMIALRLREQAILGQVMIWNDRDGFWFPGEAARPPVTKTPIAPAEWKRLQSEIKRAERHEFQLENFSEAAVLYRRILRRSKGNQVRAWILNRIVRCETKKKNYKQALAIHHSLIEDFPDSLTESGRSLNIVSRIEMLDILLADNNVSGFFQESLLTLKSFEQRFWSIDSGQVQMYSAMILRMINEAESENSLKLAPANYQTSVTDFKNSLNHKLETLRLAETVRQSVLPDRREMMKKSPVENTDLLRNAIEFEGRDVLVCLLPLVSQKPENNFEFLGSLLVFDDLSVSIDSQIKASSPQGSFVLLRSTLSDKVLYGKIDEAGQIPVLTDFFFENFPPWKIEVYQNEGTAIGFPLYKNIFFWIILALLVIVFFGSGLIIRTIVQEVNLLNLKSEFIASVSHEFKTPLTAMGAILERLISEKIEDPKKIREYYRILRHDSEKLKRLVKNVLDFTKIEDGKMEYKLVNTDISQLVRKEVESFQKENKMTGLEVKTTIKNNIPTVMADEEALSQALHNILDNAAKFSGSEREIDVNVMHKKDKVEIAVLDRGVGMTEEEQKKVFEKFYRGKQASSISPTGTGLGLTLVRHIMDGHDGSIVIQSQPGKGSRVSLILPLVKGG